MREDQQPPGIPQRGPTRIVRTFKAEPTIKSDPPPALEVHFVQPLPPPEPGIPGDVALQRSQTAYRQHADQIVKAIVHSAPGGLVDAVLARLVEEKISHFRVAFGDGQRVLSIRAAEPPSREELNAARVGAFRAERGDVVAYLRKLAQNPPAMTGYALLTMAATKIENGRHVVQDAARAAAAEGVTTEQLEAAFAEDRSTNGKAWDDQDLRRARRGAMKQERRDVVAFLRDVSGTYGVPGDPTVSALRSAAETIAGGYHSRNRAESNEAREERGEIREAEDRGAFLEMHQTIAFISSLPALWVEKNHLISMLRCGEHREKIPTPAPPSTDRPPVHPVPRCVVPGADQGTDPDVDSSCCPDEGPLSFPPTPIIPQGDAFFNGGRLRERAEIMLFLIDALDGTTDSKIHDFVRNAAKRIMACEHLEEESDD